MKSFIDEHRDAYGVEPICRVLPIAPSTYREHAARARDPARAPARQRRDLALAEEVRRIWNENFQVYGVRKIWRQARTRRIRCGALHRRTAHAADGDQRRRSRQGYQDHGQRSIGAMSA
jgi:HTH-like domain